MRYSILERLYLYAHRKYFAQRIKKQIRFQDKYIISVGNLSAGGTGKTPTTALLLQYLSNLGQCPLALLGGYKAKLSRQKALIYDGRQIFYDSRQGGDEALILARIPNIKVAIGKDRARSLELYGQESKVIVLDDAFQNPSVYHDHDLVLVDASLPLKKMRLFPCGKMREPMEALQRAQTVLLTRFDQAPPERIHALKEEILKYVPEKAIFHSRHKIEDLYEFDQKSPVAFALKNTKHSPIGAFCAVARPQAFFQSLEGLGYELKEKRSFPDHHFYSLRELKSLANSGIGIWITTAKDIARLESFKKSQNEKSLAALFESLQLRVFVLEIAIEILEGRQTEFLRRVCMT